MRFDWDQKKAKVNRRKHGVSFDEGAMCSLDPMAASGTDPDHSLEEDRYITFGFSRLGHCWPYATPTGPVLFESSMHVAQRAVKGNRMKKAKRGECVQGHKRSDFAALERGKFERRSLRERRSPCLSRPSPGISDVQGCQRRAA